LIALRPSLFMGMSYILSDLVAATSSFSLTSIFLSHSDDTSLFECYSTDPLEYWAVNVGIFNIYCSIFSNRSASLRSALQNTCLF